MNREDEMIMLDDMVKRLVAEGEESLERSNKALLNFSREAEVKIQVLAGTAEMVIPKIDKLIKKAKLERSEILESGRAERNSLIRLGWGGGMACVLFGAAIGYFMYGNLMNASKSYWGQEKESLFGAKLVQTKEGHFIMFDEDYVVGDCTIKNCISISKAK